jgi:EF hand
MRRARATAILALAGLALALAARQGRSQTSTAPAAPTLESISQQAELEFKRRDVNGDGFLNFDEMPGPLKEDLARWDRNKDNLIDFNEYRAYFLSRALERMERDGKRSKGLDNKSDDWEKRPVVYRARKLPKDLPKWFIELDQDGDGQISLAEWRRAGKSLEEFAKYDRNDDGLLTPAEVLRYEALAKAAADKANKK